MFFISNISAYIGFPQCLTVTVKRLYNEVSLRQSESVESSESLCSPKGIQAGLTKDRTQSHDNRPE